MKDKGYHQLNPLIRLKELELLTTKQYEQLLQTQTMSELVYILKGTIYEQHLNENFEDEFEHFLAEEQGKLFEWLYEMAPEPEVVSIYTSRFTFHNLKVLTKAEVLHKNLDHLFIYDGQYSLENMKSAVNTQKSTVLPDFLMHSIREVSTYLEESGMVQAIDIIYDRFFLNWQRHLADYLSYEEISKEICAFIDLTNISIMARGILQKQTETFLSTVLSSSGLIPKEKFLEYTEQSLSEFTTFLLSTDYGYQIKEIIDQETKELNLMIFDKMKDDYLSNVFEKSKVVAFGPLPLLAFLNAKEVEQKNLRLLLVGKRSHFPIEKIQERMRAYGT